MSIEIQWSPYRPAGRENDRSWAEFVRLTSNQIRRAAQFAFESHRYQRRKFTSESYFEHVQRVAHTVGRSPEYGGDPDVIAAAYLHDVIEDTDIAIEALRSSALDLSERTVEIVRALTRKPGQEYPGYIRSLSAHPEAWVIKRADLTDNLSTLPADSSLWVRYTAAISTLVAYAPQEFPTPFHRRPASETASSL